MRLKGQERIHFKSERDTRRRAICSALVTLDIHVRVYHAAELAPKIGRPRCLEALVGDLAELPLSRLVLEEDDSTVRSDRRVLFDGTGKHGLRDRLTYHHLRAKQELMLWIPDAVAWCLAKRGRMVRSRAAADRQDDDRGIETRNPARQPSGRLPGPLHQCYCPGHSPRCQSRRVCATTCALVRNFGGGDGAGRAVDSHTAAGAGFADGTRSVRPFSVARAMAVGPLSCSSEREASSLPGSFCLFNLQ